MLHKGKQNAWFLMCLCWMLATIPAQAETETEAETSGQAEAAAPVPAETVTSAQEPPTAPVKVENTPEEDYQAGIKAEAAFKSLDAVAFFKRAADAGHKKAQAKYGELLRLGQLIPEALRYFRMSARGEPAGLYGVAVIYEEGDGVKQDFGVSRFLFEMAAEQGHEDAASRLAEAYIKGQKGLTMVERQSPEALAAIRRAAGFNHLRSMDALEVAYRQGKFGIEVDKKQADAILAVTNKMRGIVVKEKKRSALFKLLKGDQKAKAVQPNKAAQPKK